MRNLIKRSAIIALTIVMIMGTNITAYAAPATMFDGGTFDAQYYADSNADVKDAIGTDPAKLYEHYRNFGKSEGRKAYADAKDNANTDNIITVQPIKVEGEVSPVEILEFMQKSLPTGTQWDENTKYSWKGYTKTNGTWKRSGGCTSFAYWLSDAIHGDAPAEIKTGEVVLELYDIVVLHGSVTRKGNAVETIVENHHAIVTGINVEAKTFTVAEANINGAIRWGATYPLSQISLVIER